MSFPETDPTLGPKSEEGTVSIEAYHQNSHQAGGFSTARVHGLNVSVSKSITTADHSSRSMRRGTWVSSARGRKGLLLSYAGPMWRCFLRLGLRAGFEHQERLRPRIVCC